MVQYPLNCMGTRNVSNNYVKNAWQLQSRTISRGILLFLSRALEPPVQAGTSVLKVVSGSSVSPSHLHESSSDPLYSLKLYPRTLKTRLCWRARPLVARFCE